MDKDKDIKYVQNQNEIADYIKKSLVAPLSDYGCFSIESSDNPTLRDKI